MEVNLQRRMAGLREKIPDIKKTLETVQFLKLRKVRFRGHFGRAGLTLDRTRPSLLRRHSNSTILYIRGQTFHQPRKCTSG